MIVRRINEFEKVDRVILKKIYHTVKQTPKDGEWRVFKGKLALRGQVILVECDFLLTNELMSVGELKINFPEVSKIIQ